MSYPGGKNGAGVYQTIINLMPPHQMYVEPFLGGAAIMRLKRAAAINIGLDLNEEAVETAMRDRPCALSRCNDVSGESFNFICGDGIRYLQDERLGPGALVYCDPPYLMETRSGKRLYKHEMSAIDHRLLLRVVMGLDCMVMISGYWSEMYAEALASWNHTSFQAMTRGGTLATEWVWYNFPEPVELHDYRYLGANFRERERIKRKTARWRSRISKMPMLEQQALLAAITNK